MRAFLIILLLLISPAAAKDLAVTDQEQINIQAICDVASTNPNISRDIRANISAFCVQWNKQMTEAQQPDQPKVAKDGKEQETVK